MSACPYHRYAVDYAEDQLEPSLRSEYEQHLAGCQSCRSAQQELKSLFALLEKKEIPYPGLEFWERVRQSVRREVRPAGRRARWWFRFAPVLAPVLAAAAWLLLIHRRPETTIDFTVPFENIIQSDDLDLLPLDALVDDSLYERMTVLEQYYEPKVDDAIDELDDAEQNTLIKSIEARYGEKG